MAERKSQPVQFRARLAAVRATPSRSDDARIVVRINLEAHDIEVDPLNDMLDRDVHLMLTVGPVERTPIEEAIEEANASADNGVVTPLPSAGRRRRGTAANPTENE